MPDSCVLIPQAISDETGHVAAESIVQIERSEHSFPRYPRLDMLVSKTPNNATDHVATESV